MRPFDMGDALHSLAIGCGLASFVNHMVVPLAAWPRLTVAALCTVLMLALRWQSLQPEPDHKPRTF